MGKKVKVLYEMQKVAWVCVLFTYVSTIKQTRTLYLIQASLLLSWRWWWWSYYIIYILACVFLLKESSFIKSTHIPELSMVVCFKTKKKVFNFLFLIKFYKYWFRMFTERGVKFFGFYKKEKGIFGLSSQKQMLLGHKIIWESRGE